MNNLDSSRSQQTGYPSRFEDASSARLKSRVPDRAGSAAWEDPCRVAFPMETTAFQSRKKVPLLRIAVVVLVVAAFVIGGVTVLGPALFQWAASSFIEHAGVSVVPQPLDTREIDARPGEPVLCEGYRFETPWTGIELEGDESTMWIHRLPDGRRVGVLRGGAILVVRDRILSLDEKRTADEFRRLLGEEVLESNLSLLRAVMSVSAEDASVLFDGSVSEGGTVLLALKGVVALNGETGIFSFEFPGLAGYQLGDLAKTRKVMIQAVDAADQPIEIWFLGVDDGPGFTQAEINRVISTFGKAPAPPK
jgi:hypothetical protein